MDERLRNFLDGVAAASTGGTPLAERPRDADGLRVMVLLRIEGRPRDQIYEQVYQALEAWHAGRGNRAEKLALKQTLIAFDLADGYADEQIAERMDCTVRTVERAKAALREILAPFRPSAGTSLTPSRSEPSADDPA